MHPITNIPLPPAPPAPPTTFRVITKRELVCPNITGIDDPDNIARLTNNKRAAIISNPLSLSDDDPCQLLGLSGSRVIARLDLIMGRVDVQNTPIPLLWASSLYVPPEYRKTLVGVTIILKMHSLLPTLAVCGVSQLALPIYETLKWVKHPMPRFLLVRKANSILRRYIGENFIAGTASLAANAALSAHRLLLRIGTGRSIKGLSCDVVSQAPDWLDIHLSQHPQPFATHRSAAFLNWQLSHTFEEYSFQRRELYIIKDGQSQPLGYFLLKARQYEVATHRQFKNLILGSLADWQIFEPERLPFSKLLYFAIDALNSWKVDAMEFCLPPDTPAPFLRRWGLIPVGQLSLLFRAGNKSPLFPGPALGSVRIRPGDGDNYFS